MRAGFHHAHSSQRLVWGQLWDRGDGTMLHKRIKGIFLEKSGSACFCTLEPWKRRAVCPTGSPLRAGHGELAVEQPTGVWDLRAHVPEGHKACGSAAWDTRLPGGAGSPAEMQTTALLILGTAPG